MNCKWRSPNISNQSQLNSSFFWLFSIFRIAQSAKGMIACGVSITHVVSCYVAFNIAWNHYFLKRLENHPRKMIAEYALRTGIVFIACKCIDLLYFAPSPQKAFFTHFSKCHLNFAVLAAMMIPNLDIFISLIGALTLSTLGILFPPFLECCARWHTTTGRVKAWMIFRNAIIGFIGFAGLVIGTSLSVGDIIRTYS